MVDLHFSNPRGVTVDDKGNIYVADYSDSAVYKVTPQGQVSLVVGAEVKPGGPGRKVEMATPTGVVVDKNGIIYVADADGGTVWKVPATGDVVGITGKPASPSADAKVDAAAVFNGATCVAADQDGNVYVGDTHGHAVRKISPAGVVTTLAGQPSADGASVDGKGTDARFGGPRGIGVDSAGIVYVADEDFGTVRKITPAGMVTTLAGNASATTGSKDGMGAEAIIAAPRGLAVDAKGNVYVACTDEGIIRKIAPNGIVTTLAGKAGETGATDGKGADARFSGPRGMAVDKAGNIYVADADNGVVRKITPEGVVSTVMGTPLK